MINNWKEIVETVSRLPTIVQCALVVALACILVLIMLYPAAGTALTSFLIALSLVIERFRNSR